MKYNIAFQLNYLPVAFIHYFPNSFSGNTIHKLVCSLFSVDVNALPKILLDELLAINHNLTEKDNLGKIRLGGILDKVFPNVDEKDKIVCFVIVFYFYKKPFVFKRKLKQKHSTDINTDLCCPLSPA